MKQLSDGTRRTRPEVPWKEIAGMRDKLIHMYFGVDLDTVWLTAVDDLPPLKETVSGLLSSDRQRRYE
ncbi:MAG: HepT-like ribonuclease domain-containing protein [Acidobacteriota bacterium]